MRHKPNKLSKEATVKKYFQNFVITGVITLFGAGAVFAAPADDPGMRARDMNQQKRVDQGTKSGQMTSAGEAGKLDAEQSKMKSDSKATKKSHKKQKKAAKHVSKKKHNKKKVNGAEKEN
jgi:hypothetical protein